MERTREARIQIARSTTLLHRETLLETFARGISRVFESVAHFTRRLLQEIREQRVACERSRYTHARNPRSFAERHACFGARLAAIVATTPGDDERGDSGGGRRRCERVVKRAASVVAAATSWPRRGDPRARGRPRRAKPARDQPRESSRTGDPRLPQQHRR